MPSRSHAAPQFGFQEFDGVLGVNDAPQRDGKGEEPDDTAIILLATRGKQPTG